MPVDDEVSQPRVPLANRASLAVLPSAHLKRRPNRCARIGDFTFGFDTSPAPAGTSSSCFFLLAASASVDDGDDETTVKVRTCVV